MSESPPPPFRRIGIVGLGLMGGSLARALKRLPDPPHLAASSVDHGDLKRALEEGVIDQAAPRPEDAATGRDLVVYATPLEATLDLLRAHHPSWGPGTVVTDMVSLKAPLAGRMRTLGEAHRYVGSHPMAGGEERGFGASREGLFQGAAVWLTAPEAPLELRGRIEAFWKALGSRPRWTEAGEHDRLMVRVSHLPQLTANGLALALESVGIGREELGPGGWDMTRLAGSAPETWEDLLRGAGQELPKALRELEETLAEIRTRLEEGRVSEVAELMRRTRQWSRGDAWS